MLQILKALFYFCTGKFNISPCHAPSSEEQRKIYEEQGHKQWRTCIFMPSLYAKIHFYNINAYFYNNLFGSLQIILYFCIRILNKNTSHEGKEQ